MRTHVELNGQLFLLSCIKRVYKECNYYKYTYDYYYYLTLEYNGKEIKIDYGKEKEEGKKLRDNDYEKLKKILTGEEKMTAEQILKEAGINIDNVEDIQEALDYYKKVNEMELKGEFEIQEEL